MKSYFLPFILTMTFVLLGCNKDNDLVEDTLPPSIELDSETGVYTVKVGRTLTISPTYHHAEKALFTWTVNGKMVSTASELVFSSNEVGDYFAVIRVDSEFGTAEEEIKISVCELTPPVISILMPALGMKVMQGTDYTITPDIQHSDVNGFTMHWEKDGVKVGEGTSYVFNETQLGIHKVSIVAKNEDGETRYDFNVEVLDHEPYVVSFPKPYYAAEENVRYVYNDYSIYLRPHLEYFEHPTFQWFVDGEAVDSAVSQTYAFTPSAPGEYNVTVCVTENMASRQITRNITRGNSEKRTTVKVVCVTAKPMDNLRPETPESSMRWNKIYDFTPAPGQFINKVVPDYFKGNETTMELAIASMEHSLAVEHFVSLGTWGGYIVVGFDHSVLNNGGDGYDFAIQGNAFSSSNEPGIVWVMQDTNGNGLPDDEWYELRGAATGLEGTIQDYEVTYFRPAPYATKNPWIDCFGNAGFLKRNMYHGQEFYYPLWKEDSYTLRGTLLPSRSNSSGNFSYEWGYVDNAGSDAFAGNSFNGDEQLTGFKISNAIYPNLTPVKLDYIDFIKVQCGVLHDHPTYGEVSTEVFSFKDL